MKTIYITEEQKKKLKKAIAAQDQVGGKVNAGVMDAVVGIGENVESDTYKLGAENSEISPYYHINESDEEIITLYHGVNRKGLEYNTIHGGFVPRVCSEGGPKAVWLSEKQYHYEFTFAFDFPKSVVHQLSNVDYIYENKIEFHEFNCRLIKTSIYTHLDNRAVIETDIVDDRLSKIQFRYFPDLGIKLWKSFKDFPNVLDVYINPYIKKYQKLSESIESKENINIQQIINSDNFKKWFGNSKVVDKNGLPLIVHHGSPKFEGNSFKKEKIGKSINQGEEGVFCTTQDMSWAKRFSYPASEGSTSFTVKLDTSKPGDILSGFLKLEHPLDFFNLSDEDIQNMFKMNIKYDEFGKAWIDEIGEKEYYKKFYNNIKQLLDIGNHNLIKFFIQRNLGNALKEFGYDGLIALMERGKSAIEYCFIEPNQFKSIYNLSFNPESDSIYESKLNESAVDLEYHYTTLQNLISMMATDTFNLTDSKGEEGRKGDYYMSLTRMRSNAEGYGYGLRETSPLIRIELDGRLLNNIRNVDITPYDYIYANYEHFKEEWGDDLKRGRGRTDGGESNEAEDSLTLRDGSDQIVDASNYINRIDIFLGNHVDNIKLWDKFLKRIETYPDWGEKMHFFTNMNDFNYQRNEIPRQKIYSIYSNQLKGMFEGRKKVIKNDKGEIVPEKCDKCGGKVVVQIHGEPVYVCKDCGKYFGTMPFTLKENKLNESIEDLEDVFEERTHFELLNDFSLDKKHGIKQKQWNLIPAQQYHTLLKRYMESPIMARIPYNVVNNWFLNIIVPNAIDINNITDFAGHSGYFPSEDVSDYFGVDIEGYGDGCEYLDSIGFYDWCVLPDGSDAWSDYGLKPLFDIIKLYNPNMEADEILILINRCLDVVHQRGDLSSAFIEGGKHSCDYISNSVNENIEVEISPEDVDLTSFNIKKKLNPKFWVDEHLDSRIRLKLLDISDDFIEYLGIDPNIVKDIIMTGSLANYNWNEKYSDIDLHVLLDYSDVDENVEFVKQYFMAQKTAWNNEHKDLKIFGFPIEVYVQDINEKHDSSGVYSLDRDKWLREPDRDVLATSKVNKSYIKDKVSEYTDKIDKLIYLYKKSKNDEYKLNKVSEKANALWDEIKNSRKIGFEKSGGKEVNNNNIIYKSLRRLGYLDKLYNLKTKTYDKLNSML